MGFDSCPHTIIPVTWNPEYSVPSWALREISRDLFKKYLICRFVWIIANFFYISDITWVPCLFRLVALRTSYAIRVVCSFRLIALRTS